MDVSGAGVRLSRKCLGCIMTVMIVYVCVSVLAAYFVFIKSGQFEISITVKNFHSLRNGPNATQETRLESDGWWQIMTNNRKYHDRIGCEPGINTSGASEIKKEISNKLNMKRIVQRKHEKPAQVPNTGDSTFGTNLNTRNMIGWEPHVPSDATRYIQPSKDTALIQGSHICQNNTKLVIIVTTTPGNFARRRLIRNTWGSMMPNHIRVGFIVGDPKNRRTQAYLEQENRHHQDIIEEDMIDTYNNLTLKSIFILKWFIRNCHNSSMLLKCDDDTLVNPMLLNQRLADHPRGILKGKLCDKCQVFRDVKSKWYVPKYMYSSRTYPRFLFGWAYFMSMDVAVKLYAAAMETPIFFLEDVYITGMCAQKAGVTPQNTSGYSNYVFDVQRDCPATLTFCHPLNSGLIKYFWLRAQIINLIAAYPS